MTIKQLSGTAEINKVLLTKTIRIAEDFQCFDLDDMSRHIGTCRLQNGCYDPVGTEHIFGDQAYKLVSTVIDGAGGRMYFRQVKGAE